MRYKALILAILIFAFILRVVDIDNNPPALYGDELTIVYDAYSLLKTGHDQTGASFPLTFSMGAGRPAGYVYSSIPFVALFGPTALGVRMLSILSGVGIVLLLYLLGKKILGEKVGLAAAVVTAFSPWDINLSRGGFEAHFALFLVLLATYLFILSKQRPILYVFSAFVFGLVVHTYPTYKLALPLFLPLLVWFGGGFSTLWSSRIRVFILISLLILFGAAILSLNQTLTGGSETRLSNINIFAQKELAESIIQKANFERSISQLPTKVSKYFHNKPVEYTKVLGENYLQNFSTDFLFIHGDRNPRHNMATIGELYFVESILILFGILAFWQRQKRMILFLITWLIIAAVPAAFVGDPHALRSSFMLPPLILFSSLGLVNVLNIRKRLLLVLISTLFVIQFAFFVQKLYFLAPNEYGRFWSYPAKLASKIAQDSKANFKYVILSDKIDNIEFAYPVYAKVDAFSVIDQNHQKSILGGYKLKKFDNVYIGNIPDGELENFIDSLDGSAIFIGSAQLKKSLLDFETIEGLDKTEALVLKRKM